MLPFKLVYSDAYYLPIGEHVFPAQKYWQVRQRLLQAGVAGPEDFVEPQPATDQDVLRVHTLEYVRKLKTGTLSPHEELQLEIPYSRELVRAFWLAAGGSIQAAELALRDGVGFNIGGGFHHAFPDHGEGFCMIHDVAIAIRRLQHDRKVQRAMTVDCDVHQGNGTAAIFGGTHVAPPQPRPWSWSEAIFDEEPPAPKHVPQDESVFTISLHQENNYPLWKPASSLDVNLPDGIEDEQYLKALEDALNSALKQFDPELICYVAGADPYREDQLGGLNLSIEGLKRRDKMVFAAARERRIRLMVTLAGGYARNMEDTVTIHCNTVIAAREVVDR